jgi:hypothetical protein
MNDTEEEVRRLFAAAAEDVPPGIDLLRGLRGRRAAHRIRTRALLSAGTAGALAAAGAITLSIGRAPSALAQVTGAAGRTAAQSYRITATTAPAGLPEPIAGAKKSEVTGEFDPARGVGEEATGDGLRAVYVGGYAYLRMPKAFVYVYSRTHKTGIPSGKTWVRFPAPSGQAPLLPDLPMIASAVPSSLGQLSPQTLLATLQSASQVRQVGSTSGPGWTGVRYTFTASKSFTGPAHLVISIQGTVDVDQQGRVRRLGAVVSTRFSAPVPPNARNTATRIDMTIGDFGLPVSVSPPPVSETFIPRSAASGPKGAAATPATLAPAPASTPSSLDG